MQVLKSGLSVRVARSLKSAIFGAGGAGGDTPDPNASGRLRKKKSKQKIKRRAVLAWLDANLPIVLPEQARRKYWDILILLFVVYNAVSVPLEATFTISKPPGLIQAEVVVDILFAMDLFYTFRTAYVDNQGHLVRDGGKIARHYIGSWFPIDLLASMPFEYLILIYNLMRGKGGGSGVDLTLLSFFKVRPWPLDAVVVS